MWRKIGLALNQPSTWRGLTWLLTAVGVALEPEQKEAIIAAGMALAGLLGTFIKDPPVEEHVDRLDRVESMVNKISKRSVE